MRSRVYFGRHVSSDGICMRVYLIPNVQNVNFHQVAEGPTVTPLPRFLKPVLGNASAALDAVGPALQGQTTETAAVQDRVQQHRVTERHAAGLADRARGEAASHFEESTRAPGSEEGRGRRC